MTSKPIRAALVALTLGATALTAMPAGAQGFGFGDIFGKRLVPCILSTGMIRRAVEDQGYTNVYLNVQNEDYIQARATRGKWVYLLDVNACTGDIRGRERLRPA